MCRGHHQVIAAAAAVTVEIAAAESAGPSIFSGGGTSLDRSALGIFGDR